MIITVNDSKGKSITVNGTEYLRTTFITMTADGLRIRYAEAGNPAHTLTLKKQLTLEKSPDAARIIFDSKNWR